VFSVLLLIESLEAIDKLFANRSLSGPVPIDEFEVFPSASIGTTGKGDVAGYPGNMLYFEDEESAVL
jgi:hypothetical protein